MDARLPSSRSSMTWPICTPAWPTRTLTSQPTNSTTGSSCYTVDCGRLGMSVAGVPRLREAERPDVRDGEQYVHQLGIKLDEASPGRMNSSISASLRYEYSRHLQ